MKNKGPRPETLKYERTHSNQMDVTHRYLSCAATVQAQRMFLFRRKNMVLGLLHQTSQLLRIFHYRETPPCSGARAPGSAKYKGLHSWLLPGSAQASYSSDEMKEGDSLLLGSLASICTTISGVSQLRAATSWSLHNKNIKAQIRVNNSSYYL